MATALQIITRALVKRTALGAGQVASDEDAADALYELASMLAEWHVAGIGLPQYSPGTLTTATDFDDADRAAVEGQLALRLTDYGIPLSGEAIQAANDSFSLLRLRYFQPGQQNFDELPQATGDSCEYSPESG